MKRLFVFDLDGTLYDLNDVVACNYENQVAFVMAKTGKSRREVVSYFNDNGIFPTMTADSKSATELFLRDGFSKDEWTAFREERFPVDKIDVGKAVSPHLVAAFGQRGVCVLLSSNSLATVKRILNRIGFPEPLFSSVVCSDTFEGRRPFNKRDAMEELLSLHDTPPAGLVSIGDRFNTDIRPALDLGGAGILVGNPGALAIVWKDFSEGGLRDCGEYRYFPAKGVMT